MPNPYIINAGPPGTDPYTAAGLAAAATLAGIQSFRSNPLNINCSTLFVSMDDTILWGCFKCIHVCIL